MNPEYRLNLPSRTIPASNPDDFRRSAKHGAQITEVPVLGNDRESMTSSGVPDGEVRSLAKPNPVNVGRIWIEVSQVFDKLGREILIKEKFQARITIRWCSRSAA